jgi:PD-(D/E)XK endonuclease
VDEMLTTDEKGQIALLNVQIEAAKKRALVLLPTTPVRFDLGLYWAGRFYRCQVKYADWRSRNATGCVRVELRRRKRTYSKDEIDAVLVYVPQIDNVCWFPPEMFHEKVGLQLRLLPAKNNQRHGCLWAADYVW